MIEFHTALGRDEGCQDDDDALRRCWIAAASLSCERFAGKILEILDELHDVRLSLQKSLNSAQNSSRSSMAGDK